MTGSGHDGLTLRLRSGQAPVCKDADKGEAPLRAKIPTQANEAWVGHPPPAISNFVIII